MTDASFTDGREKPIKLFAQDEPDLKIISTLIQDAIAERKEMLYEPNRHSFSLLLKRFRWEDVEAAQKQGREFERVQSVLTFQSVKRVFYQGFDAQSMDLAFDLIGLNFSEDSIQIAFAGNGEIRVEVEAIDVILSDVSRPYIAKVQSIPKHQDS